MAGPLRTYTEECPQEYRNVAPIARSLTGKLSLVKRWHALSSFGGCLRQHPRYRSIFGDDPDCQPLFELAFMQHFKKEANLAPPLLDFTYDPVVALYFATSSPKTGKVGTLYRFSIQADILSFSDFSCFGDLRFVVLPGVKRLSRQRGVLLYSPYGDSADQAVPYRLRFKQYSGLRFKDSALGITDGDLLHSDKMLSRFCTKYSATKSSRRFSSRYKAYRRASRPTFTVEGLYRGIVRNKDHELSLDPPGRGRDMRSATKLLKRLAAFHIKLVHDPAVPPHLRSYRTLQKAASHMLWTGSPAVRGCYIYYEKNVPQDALNAIDLHLNAVGLC